jgi:hydrogenase maturation protein HypF
VCLSGGTFQNHLLLTRTLPLLRSAGLEVYLHAQIPPNDGGVALGQAMVAAAISRD